jgi:hypothetical protein
MTELLLKSSFGDPRVPPVPNAWQEVRLRDGALFDEFIANLVKEDLSLFFRYTMRESDRERFWLRYLSVIRGTQCVLAPPDYSHLARELRVTEAGRSMLSRAVRGYGGTVSAFCLFFDRVVVVEFSDAGNAAYVYNRTTFEQHILPALKSTRINPPIDLKRRELAPERILHNANWTEHARKTLATFGVYATRR